MAIVEERYVPLGGLDQWVTVRGDDPRNPVLLVLHGGPGMPCSVLTPRLAAWERHFTVVQWDRRGAGRTFRRHGRRCGPLTFAQLVTDAVDLRTWISERLPGAPVVLLSSSAGSLVALPLVLARPELFAAWVATDLNAGVQSEAAVSAESTLAWHRTHGRSRDIRFLEGVPADPAARSFHQVERLLRLRDRAAGPLGVSAVFLPSLLPLTWRRPLDFLAILRGMSFSSEQLFDEMKAFDAHALERRLSLPFFVLHGEADPFTPASAARAYFDAVEAPAKYFELLPGGGHSGALARPDLLLEFLQRKVRPTLA